MRLAVCGLRESKNLDNLSRSRVLGTGNNLPILSVLAFRDILKNYYHVAFKDKQ